MPSHTSSEVYTEQYTDAELKIQEEMKEFEADRSKLAREVIQIRRELNRLHYKTKSYQESNRSILYILSAVNFVLLMVILYRVFIIG